MRHPREAGQVADQADVRRIALKLLERVEPPAVLVRLAAIGVEELEELITDAWRCQAPPALVKDTGI